MESGSQATEPPARKTLRVADIVGTLIALLTLLTPIVTIAHFSSVNAQNWQLSPIRPAEGD